MVKDKNSSRVLKLFFNYLDSLIFISLLWFNSFFVGDCLYLCWFVVFIFYFVLCVGLSYVMSFDIFEWDFVVVREIIIL